MARKQPALFLIAVAILAVAGALIFGATRAFQSGGSGARLFGTLLGLAGFLALLAAVACVVFAFGVDFK